jgi:hypothetical protein
LDEGGEIEVRRRRLRRPWLVGVLVLLAVLLLALWLQRKPITSHYIERELSRRGVQASYQVERVGFRTERLSHVVIGDPAHPDLTARWVEVRLAWSLGGPKVELIRGRGIRLEGRLVDGRLTLGQVDRLLPAPTGGPFQLPDQLVDIADAGMRLATPDGTVGIGIEGQGRVSDGFRGRLAVFSHRLAPAGCRVDELRASWAVRVDRRRPHLEGPVRAGRIGCGTDFAAGRTDIALDAVLEPALDGWRGGARIAADAVRASGATSEHLAGTISFAGTAAETRGRLDIEARRLARQGASVAQLSLAGPYSVAPATGRVTFAGAVATRGVQLPDRATAPIRSALAGLKASPIGPVADRWAAALARASRSGIDAEAAIHLALADGRGALRIARLDAAARSGAHLALAGGRGLELRWPGGATRITGEIVLSGGGFPEARFALRQSRPGGPIDGIGRIAPISEGDSRLALAPIRFTYSAAGTRIETVATIDGPFSGGRVRGLVLPVRARLDRDGGFWVGEGCTSVSFAALQTGTLRLGPTRLPLCPTGRALVWRSRGGGVAGGASVAEMRLAGVLGSAPLAIAAKRFRFGLADSRFDASGVAVRLGRAESVNRLDIAALTGRISGSKLDGTFAGLSGKLAAVPLVVGEGEGSWRLRGTDLDMNGSLLLSDAIAPPRFNPLASRDFHLSLADNRIEANGSLREPKTGTHVADVRLNHDLAGGRGRVLLDVPGIRFDPAFQPEQLTRLTIGIIALVDGTLKGQAEIAWDPGGTRSSGTFATENMNLAASFGPVEGLTTRLHFTDLLNLVSAPGQVATTKAIHAGVDVYDGQVRYQILPDLRVRVERGSWPFAGGELQLEDTILDFSRPSPKRLTFQVIGMDIARFVQQMQFSNIAATGTIDGIVPMFFDERGGRIEKGHLVARPEGGTLSYVGELTDRELGVYGKLAFDALKSLRYSKLVVDLNGSLEGEFLAGIQLDGIARDVKAAPKPKGGVSAMVVGRALGQLAKIPFKFNIQVKGPFRSLIGTARSFNDPTNLIQSVLPEMLRGKSTTTTVQPNESEPVR